MSNSPIGNAIVPYVGAQYPGYNMREVVGSTPVAYTEGTIAQWYNRLLQATERGNIHLNGVARDCK